MKGAIVSPCGTYRYRLWRYWSDSASGDIEKPPLIFIMLNPSTADANTDDATIRTCIAFAKALGHGGIEVLNLFALRATDPKELKAAGYLVGPDNDAHIRAVLSTHVSWDNVICAWGAQARGLARADLVLQMVREAGTRPKALAFTDDGIPRHPLYLPHTTRPVFIDVGVAA